MSWMMESAPPAAADAGGPVHAARAVHATRSPFAQEELMLSFVPSTLVRRAIAPVLIAVALPFADPAAASAQTSARGSQTLLSCLAQRIVKVDGTIVDVAVGNPAFSTLVTAVTAAGLVETLQGPGPFTVFAPTDAAFAALPPAVLGAALSDPQGLLTGILTYHVAPGLYDPRYAFVPREIRSVQGQGLFLSSNNSGAGVNQSTITCQGIRTTNGIIWVVDSVLLPQFIARP
ncbi:MAG: fasciclin domain-containing protein [Vicinamibacterales bacterium]